MSSSSSQPVKSESMDSTTQSTLSSSSSSAAATSNSSGKAASGGTSDIPQTSQSMAVRQYLDTYVVPILLQGMSELVLKRPENPIEWYVSICVRTYTCTCICVYSI